MPVKTRYFLIFCFCFNFSASVLITLPVELVKKLFHLTDFHVGKGIRRHKVGNLKRSNPDDVLPNVLPPDVINRPENHVEIDQREKGSHHDDGDCPLTGCEPVTKAAQPAPDKILDFYIHLSHTYLVFICHTF